MSSAIEPIKEQVMVLADGSEIVLVHWVMRENGVPRIACVPNLREMHAHARPYPWMRTEDTQAVTCPNCKHTPEFEKAEADYERATR